MPYKFTAKELDEETGLYYYGARYLDPKYSMWISTDPALGEYIPKAPIDEEAKKHNQNLPGMGGVFNHINGDLYAYAGNNPVRYIDPDGRESIPFECKLKMRNYLQSSITLSKMAYWINSNPSFANHIKENTTLVINRGKNDNGRNGEYYQSKLNVNYETKTLYSCNIQSTADNVEFVKAGKGKTLPAGDYTATRLNRTPSFLNAISIVDGYLIHPNAFTGLNSNNEWDTPCSGGCQIPKLADFNELIDTLSMLGFRAGYDSTGKTWAKGDSLPLKINDFE